MRERERIYDEKKKKTSIEDGEKINRIWAKEREERDKRDRSGRRKG